MERQNQQDEDATEEVVENNSDNENEEGSDIHSLGGESKEEVMEYENAIVGLPEDFNAVGNAKSKSVGVDAQNEVATDACMTHFVANEAGVEEPIDKDGNVVHGKVSKEGKEVRNEEAQDLSAKNEVNEQEGCGEEDAGKFHLEKSIGGQD